MRKSILFPSAALALIALAVGVWFAVVRSRRMSTPSHELTAAEYEVLSDFLTVKLAGQKAKQERGEGISQLVILDSTMSSDNDLRSRDDNGHPRSWAEVSASLRREFPIIQTSTTDNFGVTNSVQGVLHRSLRCPIPYELVNSRQLEGIFNDRREGWNAFYKQFPGSNGIASLSRVGFSTDGTQALFYWANECGGLCGGGGYVVMSKDKGHWVISKEIQTWVS